MVFSLSSLWWRRIRGLWKLLDGIDWLRGILGLVLMGEAMICKSLTQFSVEEWSCVPSLLFTWGQTMVEVMKIMVTSLKWSMHVLLWSLTPTMQQVTINPRLHRRLPDTHRQISCGVTVPFSWVLVHKVLLCPPRVYLPVLSKFWQLCGGVNGDLLQEDLSHTHTQSNCPCGRLLSTCTSTGDAQTQFCLILCGVPGSWCTQGLFEPSELLWQEWGLILNVIWLLLPSCWGFSFAFECGVSPHSCSSAYRLTGVSLTLDVGYLHTASPAKHSSCSRPWTSAIYSRLLQWSTGTSPDLGRRVSPHGCCSWPWTW